jgi:uncharacterized protein YidB (DUF937 family)
MRPRYGQLLQLKVTPEMDSELSALAKDTGLDRPELVRQLIDHALKQPPLLIARLAAQGRALREQTKVATV